MDRAAKRARRSERVRREREAVEEMGAGVRRVVDGQGSGKPLGAPPQEHWLDEQDDIGIRNTPK